MKKDIGNFKKIAFFILALLFVFPTISLATSKNETIKLPMKINVPCDKTWTVVFNEVLNAETIVKDNIFIKDSKGIEVKNTLQLNEDKKGVQLIPSTKYLVGEKYTIYIKNLIKTEIGNIFLKNDLEMDFTVSSSVTDLPVVGTEAKLRELLSSTNIRYMDKATIVPPSVASPTNDVKYSNTNIQVDGVVEGDKVKTDGKNIYRINVQNVEIIKAYPAEEMKVIKTIEFKNDGNDVFYPNEIYVDAKFMVIIGNCNYNQFIQNSNAYGVKASESQSIIDTKDVAKFASPYLWRSTVRVMIYDISDINNIKQIRKVEVDGNSINTRKIGKMLYLVSNDYLNYYNANADKITPGYVDTAVSEKYVNIDYKDIHYLKDSIQSSYMMLTAINLEKDKELATIYTCLGGSDNIYMSKENLYISAQDNKRYINYTLMKDKIAQTDETNIYKFQLKEDKFEFKAAGKVNGTVLNQFSMDENNNYFRIATTTNSAWNVNGQETSKNNVYILDSELNVTGKLEDMAKGEKIYSVRFMGDKGYVVTYKNIDPLFVIDLIDVSNPTILGELKIPGYSSYLEPYDENYIIGIGKDTQEADGRVTEKGIKLSLFDVTDFKNPKEKFNTVIGDAGTYSEAMHNHKALLFSKDKNILAFPITVMTNGAGNIENSGSYSKQVFQGAYVYNVDLINGFKLKGGITHLSPVDFNIDGNVSNDNKNVQRILYINDFLYTISNDIIKANNFNDLSLKNELKIGK